eukprot:4725395-Pyramimonas_sp.AAC.1
MVDPRPNPKSTGFHAANQQLPDFGSVGVDLPWELVLLALVCDSLRHQLRRQLERDPSGEHAGGQRQAVQAAGHAEGPK